MLGVQLQDRVKNEHIQNNSKVADVKQRIASLKWKWAMHLTSNHG